MAAVRSPDVAARELLKKHAVTSIPVDVELIALGEGAQIVRESLERSVSGALLRRGASTLLAVNDNHNSRRQRFTIAHELGHLVLHPGREYTVDSAVRVNWRNDLSSLATDREEIQANAFAAALLMPAAAVREAVSALRDASAVRAADVLAAKFEVSQEAMSYRLVNLGIST